MKTITLILALIFVHNFTIAQVTPAKITNEKYTVLSTIENTNTAIFYAYDQMQTTKVYTGSLAKAIKHQQIAKAFFADNNYFRAIHHTRIARAYTIKAIRLNKGSFDAKWNGYSDEEQKLFGEGINDTELNEELLKKYPNDKFLDEKINQNDLKSLN